MQQSGDNTVDAVTNPPIMKISLKAMFRCFHRRGIHVVVEPIPTRIGNEELVVITNSRDRIYYNLQEETLKFGSQLSDNFLIRLLKTERDHAKNAARNSDSASGNEHVT